MPAAGRPMRVPQASRSTRMNAALGSGSGAETLTGPATSSCAISQRMARVKSSWCTHDTYCRPSPDVPPRPASHERQQRVEHAAAIRAHRHRRAQRDLARPRRGRGVERALPRRRHLDAEPPRVRHVRLAAADRAVLVVRRPERVGVDRRRAGLDPHRRRPRRLRDGLADDPRRADPRVEHRGAVGRRVAAVDAAAGQVDHDVGAVELGRPGAQRLAVPGDHASGGRRRPARQHDDIVAIGLERPRQQLPDLTRSTRQDETHARCCAVYRAHVTRFPARARCVARPDGGGGPDRSRRRRGAGLAAVARAGQRGDLDRARRCRRRGARPSTWRGARRWPAPARRRPSSSAIA